MIRSSIARPVALAIAAVLLVAACGSTVVTPSPAPSATAAPTPSAVSPSPAPSATAAPSGTPMPDDLAAAIYDAIEQQVLDLRGLKAVSIQRETIGEDALREMNAASFDEDNPPEYVAGNERLLKALGLIDEDASLKALYLDLIDSQVAGFYRPDRKTLYVVSRSGTINGADKITFAHEYTHALQDANFPGVFDEQHDLLDQTDQALARAAVYEGDATLLMQLWAIPNLTPEELQDVIAAGADPESTAVLARTPKILVESLLFPYTAGIEFVVPRQTAAGWESVDDLYGELPTSTEQIIHADKYEAGEDPIPVALAEDFVASLGDGWSIQLRDTFGEFQFATWLREAGVEFAAATDAAAGWGGDRLAVATGPDGRWAVVMRTTWDSDGDAAAFGDAATEAIRGLDRPARVAAPGGRDVTILLASDDEALLELDKAFGATGV